MIDCIDPSEADVDLTMRHLVQEIIDRAKIFINRFQDTYFLTKEPIHEFVGLEFRDGKTGLVDESVRYRLIVNDRLIGIFSTDEMPIDDLYDVRHLIAESQMPEYQ